ncbi:MAG: succinate dehydrogenase, cytochrome b556 subunit [Acidiferrobacteraceae bacterium]|nr:succinate dehydrogenase, cytochrome b556 subunit [Acidiferrobacteraceae bacterium]
MSNSRARPISPHLQVYRPQLTSVLSIMHRLTGVFLSGVTVVLSLWLVSIALGEAAYSPFAVLWDSWISTLLMAGVVFCVYYHLLNGVRHLAWDWGFGFSLSRVYATGWAVVGGSITLTVLTFVFAN